MEQQGTAEAPSSTQERQVMSPRHWDLPQWVVWVVALGPLLSLGGIRIARLWGAGAHQTQGVLSWDRIDGGRCEQTRSTPIEVLPVSGDFSSSVGTKLSRATDRGTCENLHDSSMDDFAITVEEPVEADRKLGRTTCSFSHNDRAGTQQGSGR
jgi:hypothetical protein